MVKTESERQLNLGQIVLRIAFEDHARAFDVNFARREGEAELPLVCLLQNLCVAATQLIVSAAMHEREAASARQGANGDAGQKKAKKRLAESCGGG